MSAARLTPVPDGEPYHGDPTTHERGRDDAAISHQVLNAAVLADLRHAVGGAAFATHLGTAMRRIGDLLILLERPDAHEPRPPADFADTVGDAVHDLVGVAGLLGLTALAANLRWFDTSLDRAAPAAALRDAAAAALAALRRQQEPASAGSASGSDRPNA